MLPRLRPPKLLLVLALGLVTACPAVKKPLVGPEVQVGLTAGVTVLDVRLPTGVSLAGVGLLLGGQVYKPDAAGRFAVNKDALAKAAAQGGVTLIAPGMAPQRLGPDQLDKPIALRPAPPQGPPVSSSADHPFAQAGVGLAFPGKLLSGPTDVSVATYELVPSARDQQQVQVNDGPLGYQACPQGTPSCPPIAAALGLEVTVNGMLGAGDLPLTLDLGAWARGWDGKSAAPWLLDGSAWSDADRLRARFAVQVLNAQAGLTPTARQLLQAQYGVTFQGPVMTVVLHLGDAAALQGAVKLEVEGLDLLGAALSVTVVSAATAVGLPQAGRPPAIAGGPGTTLATSAPFPLTSGGPLGTPGGNLVPSPGGAVVNPGGIVSKVRSSILSDAAGGVLCRNGGALFSANVPVISDQGGALLANNSAGILSDAAGGVVAPGDVHLIGNNGGALVGEVKGPNLGAKYQLLAGFPVVKLPGVTVTLPYLPGQPSVQADANGRYRFDHLPDSAPGLVVVAQNGDYTLLTLTPAPRTSVTTADINPDTTAIAAEALVILVTGCANAPDFFPPGYQDATARVNAPIYTLADFARLQQELYHPPAGAAPGSYSFGQPWANQLGCTYVTARQTVQANDPSWLVVAPGLTAGTHVGFDCDLNTTFNGVNNIDYTGDPAFGGNGRILVQLPGGGAPIPFPRGQTLTMSAAGNISVQYQDYAGAGLGDYSNNSGSIATRFLVRTCP